MEEANATHWGPRLWAELRSQDPAEVCQRCMVDHDAAGFFEFDSLGTTVRVYPEEERIESGNPILAASPDFQLLTVFYLVHARNADPTGEWVSEKDLKGGSTFFRGPHALPSAPLEQRFGSDPEGFREKSLPLGATQADYGDMSMEFPVLPRMSFIIVLWTQDEEFPARITFMLDSGIETHFPLDVVYAMTASVAHQLTRV
jgi:hypothetical protein